MKDLGGFVTNPNAFTRTLKPTADGIYSQKIFGPIIDYRCECGRLDRTSAGSVCSVCGVVCASSDLRYTTFGKIKLPIAILKPNKKKEFERAVGRPRFDTTLYLGVSGNGSLKIVDQIVALPEGFRLVPVGITGVYSLILGIRYLADLGVSSAKDLLGTVFTDELLVVPPGIRPFSKIRKNGETQVVLPPLSEKYNRILRLNKGYESMLQTSRDEDTFFMEIDKLFRDGVTDQVLIRDYIINYETIGNVYQNAVNDLYLTADKLLFRKEGLVRSAMLARTIEFSARAVVVPDPSLPPYAIRVSRSILYKLWLPYFQNYLIMVKGEDPSDTFDFVRREYKELVGQEREKFDDFLHWFISQEARREIWN